MKVLAVSSWGTACGIADYLAQAKPAIEAADPGLTIMPDPEGLDPAVVMVRTDWAGESHDLLWLNYHRGLHSRWTAKEVAAYREAFKKPVVITFHDTYGEKPPDDLQLNLYKASQGFVVHEPVQGLKKAVLIRQGVAEPQRPYHYPPEWAGRPILGTVGWNFPWKNYDRLAEVTGRCGWALVLCCNDAGLSDVERWQALNPCLQVVSGFLTPETIVVYLSGCDATCFAYECANSGTSGAIRLGLAARKPVIAWSGCRQFRDLTHAELNDMVHAIDWCPSFDVLPNHLAGVPIARVAPAVAYVAHRDSWVNQGKQYAVLFNDVLSTHEAHHA